VSFACDKGMSKVVKVLLAHKADVKLQGHVLQSDALTWAIRKRRTIVKLLWKPATERKL